MFLKGVFVYSILVIGATQAAAIEEAPGLSCEGCRQIALTVGGLAISPGGINGSYELIKGPVCEAAPAELDCEKNLPKFWSAVATWIFNSADGWYAPKYFCEDLCSAVESTNEVFTGVSCEACSKRLYGNTGWMANKEILDQAVIDFKQAGFCQIIAPEDVDICNKALEIVLPIGLTTISKSGDLWIQDTCKEYIKCDN